MRGLARFDRKGAEAPQFDTVALAHGADDLVEHRIDDALDVAVIEMRILLRDLLDQFGLDHWTCAPRTAY